MKKTIVTALLSMFASLSMATTHVVTTAAEFNALPTLNAGDEVILQSGTYGALNKTLQSSISEDATATNNPILIFADNPGGVQVTEPSRIILAGRGITLAGLDFTAESGMIDNGSDSPESIIRLDTNSRYMTLSNLRFKDCIAGDDYGYWIFVRGFNNVVEYCSFEGKDAPHRNTTIALTRSSSEAGVSTPRNHIIRRCYFGPREVSEEDNGYESIRIGDSASQAYSMAVIVEDNVFYRSVWQPEGLEPHETEIISNKSADNVFRNNTFLESHGQLTLRHGDRALVEGNYFLGGAFYSGSTIVIGAANPHQSGVRIIGQDHVVRNNYFQNLQGANNRAALCVMGGLANFDDGDGTYGSNTYEAAHGAQVHHNTFVGCKQLSLGWFGLDCDTLPENCDFYNNAWQGCSTSNAVERLNGFNAGDSGGNYFYQPDGNFGWTGLAGIYTNLVSPQINEFYNHFLIPTSRSPLLDAAVNSGIVSNDIRGLARPGSNVDIGCFEREVTGPGSGPLLRSEVGPMFDGGPDGTYPVGGGGQSGLTVASAYGVPTPSIGTHTYTNGIPVVASLAGSPIENGTSRLLATGWIGTGDAASGSGTTAIFSLTTNSTITWQWQEQHWLDTEENGLGVVDVDDAWIDDGSNLTLTATPFFGHQFVNWSGDLYSADSVIHVTMDEGKSLAANFGAPVNLTVSSAYGSPVPPEGTNPHVIGNEVNAWMTGSPVVNGTTRHVVDGWTGTGDVIAGSGAVVSFTLNQASSITWQWQTQYWLDTEVSGSGSIDTADAWFESGTGVVITATPAVNHHFVSWSGDSTSTNPVLNLTVDAAKAVTAAFAQNSVPPPEIPVPERVGDGLQFTVHSASGTLYQLQYTPALTPTSWMDMGAPVSGDGGDVILADPGPLTTNGFYRLSVQP